MVTVGWTVSVPRLLERAITAALIAGWVRPTVQTVFPPLVRVVGMHVSALNWSVAARLIVAVRFWPLSVAVTVA
jgi:hypothetical protein